MLHADALTVVYHDDTTTLFEDVTYALDRVGLRIVTATGDEKAIGRHDVLTTHARLTHQRRPTDASRAPAGLLPARA
jgi:hypothetical protein